MSVRTRALLLAAMVVSCEEDPSEAGAEAPAVLLATPVLEGCAALEDGVCERPPPGNPTWCQPTLRRATAEAAPDTMKLALWYPDPYAELRVEIDGEDATPSEVEKFDDGQRVDLEIEKGAGEMLLRYGEHTVATWHFVDPEPEPEELARAREALVQHPGSADRDGLRRDLEKALPYLEPHSALQAADLLADLAFQEATVASAADRQRKWTEAFDRTDEVFVAAERAHEFDRASCHARRSLFAALEMAEDGAEVDRWRDRLRSIGEQVAGSRTAAHNAYYEGALSDRYGDAQRALQRFRMAEQGAERWGDARMVFAAQVALAAVYGRLGLDEAASGTLARASVHAASHRCLDWLDALNYEGWIRLQLAESGRSVGDPIAPLEAARAVLLFPGDASRDAESEFCGDARRLERVQVDLALAAATEGWAGYALDLLASLPAEGDSEANLAFWREEAERRARTDPGALIEWLMRDEEWDRMTLDQVWTRAWGRGRGYEALGLIDDALASYARAEQAADELARRLDHDAGRDHVSFGHHRSAGRRASLLVARGEVQRASCLARMARRRTMTPLDRAVRVAAMEDDRRRSWEQTLREHERLRAELETLEATRWQVAIAERSSHEARIGVAERSRQATSKRALELLSLSVAPENENDRCSHLFSPADGELALLYFPSGVGDGWLAFAFSADETLVATIEKLPRDDADPSRWADALLGPFAAAIDRADSIRVMPSASLWTIAFEALPWRDDVLLSSVQVSYSLDLDKGTDGRTRRGSRRAVIVADPAGNLAHSVFEAAHVESSLMANGWRVESLRGDEAKSGRVREAVHGVELFHYVGHGHRAGIEGWQSALRLANDEQLTVEDVLAVREAPSIVVLPACDTMPTEDATLGGGMSIARAFLLGGAETVVGSAGEIDDAFAMSVVRALYAGSLDDPSRALRRALLAVRNDPALTAEQQGQWMRVRVLTR